MNSMNSTPKSNTHSDKFLLFFKNREKFFKGVAGAIFNFSSRVTAGVLAGWITTQFVAPNEPLPVELTPEQVGAITGAVN